MLPNTKNIFPVNLHRGSPESLKAMLIEVSTKIDRIHVAAAKVGEHRDENTSTKNGKTYRRVYRVYNGKKTSVGNPGGDEDKELRLSLKKRNCRVEADQLRAKIDKLAGQLQDVYDAIAKLDAEVDSMSAAERQKISASSHRKAA